MNIAVMLRSVVHVLFERQPVAYGNFDDTEDGPLGSTTGQCLQNLLPEKSNFK
jgi:hypothetical protein